ncbi:MAG: hypothetical protein D3922_13115, partial [Candidatus Electrothrix sp. AR1]|nr:hypothetical protein [Candidatus Electrothrix sp. AR1]
MKRILLRMVASEDGELTLRRVPKWELLYPDEKENKRVAEVINRLLQKRFILVGSNETSKGKFEPYIELAHNALIFDWKIKSWQAEEAEAMMLHRHLTQAAADWEGSTEQKEKKKLLWDSNPRLLNTQEYLEQKNFSGTDESAKDKTKQGRFRLLRQFCKNLFPSFELLDQHVWLNRVETDFVRRSIVKKSTQTRRVTGIIVGVILSLSAITFFAWMQKRTAEKNLRRVEAIQLARESEAISSNTEKLFYSWASPGGAKSEFKVPLFTEPLRLGIKAILKTLGKDNYVTREAFDALRQAVGSASPWKEALLISPQDRNISPHSISWSPSGEFLAAISKTGEVVVWKKTANKNFEVGRAIINKLSHGLITWCGNSHFVIDNLLFSIKSNSYPKLLRDELTNTARCNSAGTKIVAHKERKLYFNNIIDNSKS